MSRTIVMSYGGGRQTAAMCVAVKRRLIPRPDIIVMADTGRESSATWEYLNDHIRPYLATIGLEVNVAPHSLATKDLYGGSEGDSLLIPAWTETGMLPAFCSGEWKRDVVRRRLRQMGVKECVMWLGYSLDEMKRMHMSRRQWIDNQFPLIDPLRWRVTDCIQVVKDEGLPPPPKSACWMCPHTKRDQWKDMRDNRPEDFAAAVSLDTAIRQGNDGRERFLYKGRVPLSMADLDTPENGSEANLFTACESGHCWT